MNLKELREKKASLEAKAQAILDLATEEKRELTPQDQADFDAIMGAKDRPGQIDAVQADIERWEKIEARSRQSLQNIHAAQSMGSSGRQNGTRIEYVPQRHAKLVGFESVADAYVAGASIAASLGQERAQRWCRDNNVVFNAMSAASNPDGGFLVPEQMETAITRLVVDYGVIRRFARNYPMSTETATLPKRTAGVTAYWTSDVPAAATTESSPKAGQDTLTAKPLTARTLISKFLQEDSFANLAGWVAQEVAMEFARMEDDAGFNGDGTSTYGGIVGLKNALNAGSVVTAGTGQTSFGALTLETFEYMIAALPTYALSGARWFMSRPAAWYSALNLQDAVGGNQSTNLAEGPRQMFLGFPIEYVEVMNAVAGAQANASGVIYFGNMSQAMVLGNRRGITPMVLNELYAATFQIGLLYTQRLDIVVTEKGTASTAGSVVSLTLAAS